MRSHCKNLLFLLICMICTLIFTGNIAKADIMYEPSDSFYYTHHHDCDYVNRHFIISGPKGEAKGYEDPESTKVEKTLKNGTRVYVPVTYQDKNRESWGFAIPSNTSVWDDNGYWISLKHMVTEYDYQSFEEEHKDEIVHKSDVIRRGNLDTYIMFWNYPGDTTPVTKYEVGSEYPRISSTYTDPEGRNWGYCSYHYGERDFWICLDEPSASYKTLFPNGCSIVITQETNEYSDPANMSDTSSEGNHLLAGLSLPLLSILAVMIIGVIAISVFLLRKL